MPRLCLAMAEMPPPDLPGLVAAWSGVLPLLTELEVTPQDPEWHGEGSVAVHTGMVLAEARRIWRSRIYLIVQ